MRAEIFRVIIVLLNQQEDMERLSISTLSSNEVYNMNFLILLVKIMLRSKLHCQKVLD